MCMYWGIESMRGGGLENRNRSLRGLANERVVKIGGNRVPPPSLALCELGQFNYGTVARLRLGFGPRQAHCKHWWMLAIGCHMRQP